MNFLTLNFLLCRITVWFVWNERRGGAPHHIMPLSIGHVCDLAFDLAVLLFLDTFLARSFCVALALLLYVAYLEIV